MSCNICYGHPNCPVCSDNSDFYTEECFFCGKKAHLADKCLECGEYFCSSCSSMSPHFCEECYSYLISSELL